jgi:hypothetical protein
MILLPMDIMVQSKNSHNMTNIQKFFFLYICEEKLIAY